MKALIALGLLWGVLGLAGPARAEDPSPTTAASPAVDNPEPPASPLAPPTNLVAADEPNDSGHGVRVSWTLSPDDAALMAYEVWMAPAAEAPPADWTLAGSVPRGTATLSHTNEEPTLEGKPNPQFVPRGTPV